MIASFCCVFEDHKVEQLWPLAQTKPVVELHSGSSTLLGKYFKKFGAESVSLVVRPELEAYSKEAFPGIAINTPITAGAMWFFNARSWCTPSAWAFISKLDPKDGHLILSKGEIVAIGAPHEALAQIWETLLAHHAKDNQFEFIKNRHEREDVLLLAHPWDFLNYNTDILRSELSKDAPLGVIKGKVGAMATVNGEMNLFTGKGSVIEDFVYIDATQGPVYLSEGVVIESGSRLEGPLYVGPNSRIMGGKISKSTIGPGCKISGEVSKSIWNEFSNKAHQGYVGDSYIGSWVNLGAMTTTSNLKNTYDVISIIDKNGEKQTTGTPFLGSIIGDHSKTAIGTLLNTGTLVGVGCNLLGTALHQGRIFDFSWGTAGQYVPYRLEKFLQTGTAMMGRRQLVLKPGEEQVLEGYYQKRFEEKKQ